MKLHHIGIVVKDCEVYGEAYARLLGLVAESELFYDPIQKVRVQFWRDREGSFIELIEPVGNDSPVWREAQKGGGLNHLCYETSDIEQTINDSLREGAIAVRPIAPAIAFEGRRIAFLYFFELGLIEFVETHNSVASPEAGPQQVLAIGR
jgi:methylmalonyl-CoA/ethylmalonyl-CoA epimerase